MQSDNLFTLTLTDGLPSTVGTQSVRYKTVELRETTVADELAAVQMAERVVYIAGKPTLLVSDETYRVAMTLRHVQRFTASGLDPLDDAVLDLRTFSRLSPQDLSKIEQRCLLITMAAQLRHGLIDQAEFDLAVSGQRAEDPSAPRSEGHSGEVAEPGAESRDGPAMLADYAATDAKGAA